MASDRHLVFVLRQFATTQKGQKEWLVVFIAVCRCAKFGWDYQRTCEDVSFNVMGFGLKMPIHATFWGENAGKQFCSFICLGMQS